MRRVINKKRDCIILLAFIPAFGMAQQIPAGSIDTSKISAHALSVKQAIDYARKNNVQVKNALLDVQIQQQTNREVTSSALPTDQRKRVLYLQRKIARKPCTGRILWRSSPALLQKLLLG